eukprot:scaffold310891_cov35-Prasinocladus_malaysianus.AAC.1
MWSTAVGVVSREGVAGLYKGIGPTLCGILPYAGIKFYVYQKLKEKYRWVATDRIVVLVSQSRINEYP